MKYKVIKGTLLHDCLEPDEEDLRWDITDIHFEANEINYYVIETIKDNNEFLTIGALPDEIEEVELTFAEQVLEGIKTDVNELIELL